MGCGDWNDGMNLVGEKRKGESVWLAFFLCDVLKQFSILAKQHGDKTFAQQCEDQAKTLADNIEKNAWDGQWYRRAYFDNGDPLGSATNSECQIDSLPQSWAIISGVGNKDRARTALDAVAHRLVRREARLIQLFDPPFDKSALEPGYIKGYVPGLRENGGQYTHAAVWTIMAFALAGETARAWEFFKLINPVLHTRTLAEVETYKVEPYVMAADVYSLPPHTGRGGWTWYTGAAGWTYRLLVERCWDSKSSWMNCNLPREFRKSGNHSSSTTAIAKRFIMSPALTFLAPGNFHQKSSWMEMSSQGSR